VTLLSVLTTIAAVLGLAIWRGWWTRAMWPFYRPVALALLWVPLHDVAQWAIATRLEREPAPYAGAEALLLHLHAALVMSWPAALLGVALVVFRRRSPWPAAAIWAVASVGAALAYPALRLGPRWAFYGGFSALCCAAIAWVGIKDIRRRLREGEILMAHHLVPLTLALGQVSASVAYLRGKPLEDWDIWRLLQGVAFVAVITYESWVLWRNRPES
jgi:hypothetical protein